MVLFQKRAGRKLTGGAYKRLSVKRLHMTGSQPAMTKLGERRVKEVRTVGGHAKQRLLLQDVANVFDPKAKTFTKAAISTIVENGANRNFARRNIMTKGTIIETSAGKARITNRPGQEGAVNAILLG